MKSYFEDPNISAKELEEILLDQTKKTEGGFGWYVEEYEKKPIPSEQQIDINSPEFLRQT